MLPVRTGVFTLYLFREYSVLVHFGPTASHAALVPCISQLIERIRAWIAVQVRLRYLEIATNVHIYFLDG